MFQANSGKTYVHVLNMYCKACWIPLFNVLFVYRFLMVFDDFCVCRFHSAPKPSFLGRFLRESVATIAKLQEPLTLRARQSRVIQMVKMVIWQIRGFRHFMDTCEWTQHASKMHCARPGLDRFLISHRRGRCRCLQAWCGDLPIKGSWPHWRQKP